MLYLSYKNIKGKMLNYIFNFLNTFCKKRDKSKYEIKNGKSVSQKKFVISKCAECAFIKLLYKFIK